MEITEYCNNIHQEVKVYKKYTTHGLWILKHECAQRTSVSISTTHKWCIFCTPSQTGGYYQYPLLRTTILHYYFWDGKFSIPKKSWRICFGNPGSKSMIDPKNRKSYLENRKSYEFLNAIFEFRLKDLFWKSWIKIEDVPQKWKKLSREP